MDTQYMLDLIFTTVHDKGAILQPEGYISPPKSRPHYLAGPWIWSPQRGYFLLAF
jgi:hypothetical protein